MSTSTKGNLLALRSHRSQGNDKRELALLYKALGSHEVGQGSGGESSEPRRTWDAGVFHGVCLAGTVGAVGYRGYRG